jgi:hypothetical protein
MKNFHFPLHLVKIKPVALACLLLSQTGCVTINYPDWAVFNGKPNTPQKETESASAKNPSPSPEKPSRSTKSPTPRALPPSDTQTARRLPAKPKGPSSLEVCKTAFMNAISAHQKTIESLLNNQNISADRNIKQAITNCKPFPKQQYKLNVILAQNYYLRGQYSLALQYYQNQKYVPLRTVLQDPALKELAKDNKLYIGVMKTCRSYPNDMEKIRQAEIRLHNHFQGQAKRMYKALINNHTCPGLRSILEAHIIENA